MVEATQDGYLSIALEMGYDSTEYDNVNYTPRNPANLQQYKVEIPMKEKRRDEYDEPPQEGKPPSVMDIIARCFSAIGLLCRKVSGHLDRVDSVCLVRGSRLCRRYIDVQNFRAQGQGEGVKL